MTINDTSGWFSFKEKTPTLGQSIIVHTISDLVMDAVYTPFLNLEDACDAWKPRTSKYQK